jgi:hypothetical protein
MSIPDQVSGVLSHQGEDCLYVRTSGATRSTTTLKKSKNVENVAVKAHIIKNRTKSIGGQNVENRREIRIAAVDLPFDPKIKDTIQDSKGNKYVIEGVDRRTAYGVDALFILEVEGGS